MLGALERVGLARERSQLRPGGEVNEDEVKLLASSPVVVITVDHSR